MNRIITILAAAVFAIPLSAPAQNATPSGRDTYFISDLHLGLGRNADGTWHPMEDFRWYPEFDAFLKYTNESTRRPADLVILGDFLELWQSDLKDCQPMKDKDFGCSVKDATDRTRRVVAAHPVVFASLADFIRRGDNTVTIVPGNHDAALLLPEPRKIVIDAFPEDVRSRVTVRGDAIWTSSDGSVVAEHGQQIGEDPNKYVGWPQPPTQEYEGVTYIVQPWGERFVQSVFNNVEVKYPIIDNFSGRLEALGYYKASSNWREELKDMARLLRFLATQQSSAQFRQLLAADGTMHATWDIEKTKQQLTTNKARWEFLLSSLPDAEMRDELAKEPPPEIAVLDNDDDVRAVCDVALAASACPNGALCHCVPTEQPQLSAIGEGIAKSLNSKKENKIISQYLSELAKTRLNGNSLRFYVYGHTHDARPGFTPGSADITVYNDGAWQRTISVEELETLRKAKTWTKAQLLDQARPEHLPACYPFVHMRPASDHNQPAPILRYWNYRETDAKTCPSEVCNRGFLQGGPC